MADHGAAEAAGAEAPPKKKGKLLLIAIPVLLLVVGAGLWFGGIIPNMLGGGKHHAKAGAPPPIVAAPAVYVDVPEMIANLSVSGRRPSFIKLHAKLELFSASDQAAVTAAMPRILDLFQTYLREMRPEDLHGAEGSYRLREELLSRVSMAVAPARIANILFVDMVIE